MTMPVLINNIRNKQLETAFKAAYSLLSQAVMQLAYEEGGGLIQAYATVDSNEQYHNSSKFRDKFYQKLKISGTCTYPGPVRNYSNTKDLGVNIGIGTPTPRRALANGMCFGEYINQNSISLTIDINGIKRPNQWGHDIFVFLIDRSTDRLVPIKMTKLYSEEEIEDILNGDSKYPGIDAAQAGSPCSMKSSQEANGLGCSYYALIDKNPDDETKGFWESLK